MQNSLLHSDRKPWPFVQRQQGSASHSFLLDDDSSNPFNANDVQTVMDDKTLYAGISPPAPLRESPAFEFLQHDLKLSAPPAAAVAPA
jgi:hypothetical protein